MITSWRRGTRIGVTARIVKDTSSYHMSMLRKYIADPSHVLRPQAVKLSEDLTYEDYLLAIVDRQVRQLRTKNIPMVKVLWSNHSRKLHVGD